MARISADLSSFSTGCYIPQADPYLDLGCVNTTRGRRVAIRSSRLAICEVTVLKSTLFVCRRYCVDMNTTQRFSIRSPKDLARTITEARLVRKITQSDLAIATGIDRTYLSRLENGLEAKQLERAFHVLRILGVHIEAHMETELE